MANLETLLRKFEENKNDGLVVVSLFDGGGCCRQALKKSKIKVAKYYASEIKKSAIKCCLSNHTDIIHIGDVTKVRYEYPFLITEMGMFFEPSIDCVFGGSPCQDFSPIKTSGKGLDGDKSKLFYEFLRILKESSPKFWLLENIKMKKDSYNSLNEYLGIKGDYINSIDFSYQNRPRYYWTNIEFNRNYKPKRVDFQKFIERDFVIADRARVKRTPSRIKMWNNGNGKDGSLGVCANITNSNRCFCLTRKQDRSPNSGLIAHGDFCRYMTRRELEIAQTMPVGYTNAISYPQAQDILGDGWTLDVICHIFKGLK